MREWRPTKYAGYSVSSDGLVRSEPRSVERKDGITVHYKTPRIKKQQLNKNGYLQLQVSSNETEGYKTHVMVHRLVAEAFVPNPEGKPQVTHKDGNTQNNDYRNLVWTDKEESFAIQTANGLEPDTRLPKKVYQYKDDMLIAEYPSVYAAAKALDTKQFAISRAARGLRKSHLGFEWSYEPRI